MSLREPTTAPPWWQSGLLGFGAGLLAGLFGVGGGLVLVPGLVLLGLRQHEAHATSLAAITVLAPAALLPFALDGAVAWAPGGVLTGGALLGAVAGASLMRRVPPRHLRQAFAVLVLVAAARLALGAVPAGGAGPPDTPLVLLALVGLGTGALSAVLGVGGGVVLVPALVVLFGFPQHLAEGTSLLVIVPTAVTGALRHAQSSYTRWGVGLAAGATGIAGGLVGGGVAVGLPETVLQRSFAGLLTVVAARLLWREGRKAASDAQPSGSA